MSERFNEITEYELAILTLSLDERMLVLDEIGGEEYQPDQRAMIRALQNEIGQAYRKAIEARDPGHWERAEEGGRVTA